MKVVHMLVEVTDDLTTILGVYGSVHKAISEGESLAKEYGLIRDRYVNYEHVWASDERYPVIFIDSQEVVE
jgi:hypothetical protein